MGLGISLDSNNKNPNNLSASNFNPQPTQYAWSQSSYNKARKIVNSRGISILSCLNIYCKGGSFGGSVQG